MRGKQLTNIEKEMQNILTEIGLLNSSYDYPVRSKYRYRIDFAFPEINFGIECDGEYWHPPENKHDKRRDGFLGRREWFILRFTGDEIMNHKEEVKQRIIEASKKRLGEVR
jgi:very-short-patch-repair endonuclease